MLPILQRHHDAHSQGALLMVPYVTVNEYLWLLRAISEVMGGDQGVGREGLFYLACAVSDFFLPADKMVSTCVSPSQAPRQSQADARRHLSTRPSTRSNRVRNRARSTGLSRMAG